MTRWPEPAWGALLLFLGLGYALGVLNAAYYLVRGRRGCDIRDLGSGTAGATNAGRVLGRRGFLIVLTLDAAKGAVAVGLARWLSGDPWVILAAQGGAVLGHIWPLQLGFRGGKGVATLVGGWIATNPVVVLLLAAMVPLLQAMIGRFVISGLLALAITPLVLHLLDAGLTRMAGDLVLVGVVWFAHRRDLRAELRRVPGNAPADPEARGPNL